MRFEDLNWFDVEKYLEQENRLIVVVGACEQHGYLSLLTDLKIPLALADAASQQTGVLVAPPLPFGVSPYFLSYPGTLSLKTSTYLAVMEDIVTSAYRQGFRQFLVLNGHGGNNSARTFLHELANELPEFQAAWYSWWLAESVLNVAKKYNLRPSHANWLEAFSFTRVADLPGVKKPIVKNPGIVNSETTREKYGDGSFGGRYQVDDAIMHEVIAAALQDILELLKFS